jgi:phenylacetate-CoA ligase
MSGLYAAFFRGVVHPAYHALRRDGMNGVLRSVLAADELDAEALAELQRGKLATMLRHARANVPFYGDVIPADAADAVAQGEPLHAAGLPVLTKALIRDHLDALTANNLPRERFKANSTSGSTGEPTRFMTDIHATVWRRAVDVRNQRWLGVDLGERAALLWGSQIDNRLAHSLRGRLHGWVTRQCALDAYDLSDARMAAYLRRLQQYRPSLLTGYPSVLERFGRWCEARDERIASLKGVICSAEALYEEQRSAIEATLHAPVFNRYGCREVGCIAHERPGSRVLLINADRLVVELLDERGRPSRPGDLGYVHVTDLDSFAMPLIRYRIGDLAVAGEPRPGSPWPVLERVEGRSLDVIRSPDGRAVGGTFWTILLRNRPGLRQFQVIQDDPGRVRVLYVPEGSGGQPDFDYFRAGIRKACGPQLAVDFEQVERILPEQNGKFRVVKSLLSDAGPGT